MKNIKQTTIDLTSKISVKDLSNYLKQDGKIIVNTKEKKFEIEDKNIKVMNQQSQLLLEHIPSQIEGMKISDLQKQLLLNGQAITVGKVRIEIGDDLMNLVIHKPNEQRTLKISQF